MLRRVFHGTGCLLLGRFRISIYEAVSNVKETYTSDGKIPGKAIYSGIHFSRNQKIAKGDEMNFIKERLLKLSRVLLRNKVVFSYEDLASHHLNG
jgi:hypothetical protein